MVQSAAPQRGARRKFDERRIWLGLGIFVLGAIVLAAVLYVAFFVFLIAGYGMHSRRLHSGPPVKDVSFDGHTLALVLPNQIDGEYLRILVIEGQPEQQCVRTSKSASILGQTDELPYGGSSYPIICEWMGKDRQAVSSHGSDKGNLRPIGGPEIGIRMAFKTNYIADPAASRIAADNCAVVVFTGAAEAYIAPIRLRQHIEELRD